MPFRKLAGRRIHYRDEGRGPAVVCLHCSSSHSGQWKPLIARLGDRFRVIAPDLHGYGRSDPLPNDGQPWFMHDAEMIGTFLDAEGPAHLVGHSLGGAAAFAAARGRTGILSLTMIEPVLFGLLEEAGHPEAGDPLPAARRLCAALDAGDREAAARGFVAFWSGRGAFDAMDARTRAYVADTLGRVRREFEELSPATPGAPSLADARRLDLPVLLVRGGATRPSARAIVDLLAGAIPGARVVDVPGAAHMAAVTDPELINPHIAAFLDGGRG